MVENVVQMSRQRPLTVKYVKLEKTSLFNYCINMTCVAAKNFLPVIKVISKNCVKVHWVRKITMYH